MPALDTSVKIYDSSVPSAPTLSNGAGNLIAVLDACLVNGFAPVTCDSAVLSSGIATATIAAGHAARAQAVVLLAGSGTSGLNGEHKVLSTTATTVVFDAYGVADGTASGTITLKIAGAGWLKAFSGTHLAAYKSSHGQATGSCLRIDDTGTTNARALGYVTMSDINTATLPFPNAVQLAGGAYVGKSNTSGNRNWWLVANERFFYLAAACYASYPSSQYLYAFKDIIPKKAADAYRCALFFHDADRTPTASYGSYGPVACCNSSAAKYVPRSCSAIGSPVYVSQNWMVSASSTAAGAYGYVFPNPEDNGIVFTPISVIESSTVRGTPPGIYAPMQDINTRVTDAYVLEETASFARKVMYRNIGNSSSAVGGVFFDVTGPWPTT